MPVTKWMPVVERRPLGEAQECWRCGGVKTRRAFPWVVTWRQAVPQSTGRALVAANRRWLEGDTLEMGATTPACEALHRKLVQGVEGALGELGVASELLRTNHHPSSVVGPGPCFTGTADSRTS